MSNLILVFFCLIIGLVLQRRFSPSSAEALNAYVIHIALPALILEEISRLSLTAEAMVPVAMAWSVMAFSAITVFTLAKLCKWSPSVTGALLLVVTLGNTSFVGFPLIEAHLGREALPYAILYDQLGTFLALNTFGIFVAAYYSQHATRASAPFWVKLLTFPPFIALVIAFALRPVNYPTWAMDVLSRLAATLVPVVMVAVGLQWRLKLEREYFKPFAVALVCILVLQPTFALVLVETLDFSGLAASVTVLEAAMPAMISAGVLATANQLAPRLASAIVSYSLLFSLGTVWIWRVLLTQLP